MSKDHVLQIVPRLPGSLDGVGDYALNLAHALAREHGLTTTFLLGEESAVTSKDGFEIVAGLRGADARSLAGKHEHVILHYVNYGYQARGIPFALRGFVRRLRAELPGGWITTFHEIYASGPPWKSEFWLHPLQVRIARDLIDLSDACVTSNAAIETEIHCHDAAKRVQLAPVMSTFGEPILTDFSAASRKRWAICGGVALLERSLRSFEQIQRSIPGEYSPEHLDVIGGRDQPAIRALVGRVADAMPGLICRYHPEVSADEASELLRQCSFAWIDYFPGGRISPGMILKSTVFAACCAHGVVPVLSHREDPFVIDGESFPGFWFINSNAANFPKTDRLSAMREKIYRWYRAHASAVHLARLYAELLHHAE